MGLIKVTLTKSFDTGLFIGSIIKQRLFLDFIIEATEGPEIVIITLLGNDHGFFGYF